MSESLCPRAILNYSDRVGTSKEVQAQAESRVEDSSLVGGSEKTRERESHCVFLYLVSFCSLFSQWPLVSFVKGTKVFAKKRAFAKSKEL